MLNSSGQDVKNGVTSMQILELFSNARRAGVPLIVIRTADPAATMRTLAARPIEQDGPETPVLHWNLINGLEGFNDIGAAEAKRVSKKPTFAPADMLSQVATVADDSLVFMQNAQRFWNDPPTMQAIWNLRDLFKPAAATLAMLVTRGATLPAELAQDALIFDEPLPDAGQLATIVTETYVNAEVAEPDAETIGKATDALVGLAAFPAEQSAALCISRQGLNLNNLWERKRQIVEQTQGLSVNREGATFDEIGGNGNVISFLQQLSKGKKRLRGIVFADELEKAAAGFGTDTSGTKTEMVGTFLQWTQDRKVPGLLFRGISGSGKSAVAKAFGNTIGALTVRMNLEAMQGSLVGQTGERLRAALAVIDAIFQGDCILIATINRTGQLPPELQSRFTLGTFFFDIPTVEERAAIWKIYMKRHELPAQKLPPDHEWTGREIEACCYKAWLLNISLVQAASYVVPIAKSEASQIAKMREEAQGSFISASQPGPYQIPAAVASRSRKIKSSEPDIAYSAPPKIGDA